MKTWQEYVMDEKLFNNQTNIKMVSTGDNDSIEDALVAIMRIKTLDGKYIHFKRAFAAVVEFEQMRQQIIERLWDEPVSDVRE